MKLQSSLPRRDCLFEKQNWLLTHQEFEFFVQQDGQSGQTEALKSIINNYEVLQELWIEAVQIVKDTDMKARINGVASQMKNFDYFYGVHLGDLIHRHSDNLSKTLQKTDISAAEGQEVASMTLKTLESIRSDSKFQLFWQRVCMEAQHFDVSKPCLPRRRKVPRRFEDGEAEGSFAATPEMHYRRIYFEALDLIVMCISTRFDQPGYRVYSNVQNLILKVIKGVEYKVELDFVTEFYKSDFNTELPTRNSFS